MINAPVADFFPYPCPHPCPLGGLPFGVLSSPSKIRIAHLYHHPTIPRPLSLEISTPKSRPQLQGFLKCVDFSLFRFSLLVLRVPILPVLYDAELFPLQRIIDTVSNSTIPLTCLCTRRVTLGYTALFKLDFNRETCQKFEPGTIDWNISGEVSEACRRENTAERTTRHLSLRTTVFTFFFVSDAYNAASC